MTETEIANKTADKLMRGWTDCPNPAPCQHCIAFELESAYARGRAELAAAEERGRRRGVEERKRRDEPPNESDLLARIARLEAQVRGQQRCEKCGGWWYEPWVLVCACEAKRWHDAVLGGDAAIAPRDSGKEG